MQVKTKAHQAKQRPAAPSTLKYRLTPTTDALIPSTTAARTSKGYSKKAGIIACGARMDERAMRRPIRGPITVIRKTLAVLWLDAPLIKTNQD